MAQCPKGGLYGPPSKGHVGVCAIYSETTVVAKQVPLFFLASDWREERTGALFGPRPTAKTVRLKTLASSNLDQGLRASPVTCLKTLGPPFQSPTELDASKQRSTGKAQRRCAEGGGRKASRGVPASEPEK